MTEDLKTAIAEAMCPERAEVNGCRDCLLDFLGGASSERKQCAQTYQSFAQAALQAIHDAGYVVVPREPSEAMCEAADPVKLGWAWRGDEACCAEEMADIYRAMIQACQPNTTGDGQ